MKKKIGTPAEYIAALEEPKRSEVKKLHALIRRAVPGFAPFLWSNMIGYGSYHYRYPSGREGDCSRVALSANKTGISIYVHAVDAHGWLVERSKDKLGKASVGKSCIRFKKLADVELGALEDILRKSKTMPTMGEVAAPATKTRKRKSART